MLCSANTSASQIGDLTDYEEVASLLLFGFWPDAVVCGLDNSPICKTTDNTEHRFQVLKKIN
jgi:hypothetical protein